MIGHRTGLSAGFAALSPNVQGALLALAGAVAFSAMGALVRVLSLEMPTATILFFRSAFSLPVLLLWMLATGRAARLRTQWVGWHFARAVAGVGSLACLIVAYRHLDFALATALAFTTPLWVIVLSILFIGERPGWRRSAATVLGFVGVLIIIRPLPELGVGVWAALASAALGAMALSFLRHLSRLEPAETLLLYFFLFSMIISAGPALHAGQLPDLRQALLLVAIATVGMAGLACAANAFSRADATVVAPFDFMRLPIAGVIGLLVFGEVPDAWLLAGAAVMIGALYMIIVFGRRPDVIYPALGEGERYGTAAAPNVAPAPNGLRPEERTER
jgi:drug/metabolite transporter (DMT)-like permease